MLVKPAAYRPEALLRKLFDHQYRENLRQRKSSGSSTGLWMSQLVKRGDPTSNVYNETQIWK